MTRKTIKINLKHPNVSRKYLTKMNKTMYVFLVLKGQLAQKWKSCHLLLTLRLFQTYMNFFLLLSTKEDIFKEYD